MKAVVDTNVTIAANGKGTHASFMCQIECIEFLQNLVVPESKHQIYLDDRDLILEEYGRHLNHKGEPGVGDRFYKFLHDNMYSMDRVRQVSITPVPDEARGFDELPPNTLDNSDRKFLAVALVADTAVYNALDTDWHESSAFIVALGVKVEQLCPEHGCL